MDATSKTKFKSVEEYLSTVPKNVRDILEKLRKVIQKTAPGAEELISYNMPAFRLNGMLVWYAANKEHIGFYPTPSAIRAFKEELSGYKTSKGAIQFPLERTIPLALVKSIVKFRMKENLQKSKKKK